MQDKEKIIKSYKGMNKDMQCNGFQYEVGKTYETDNVKCCAEGFHACEMPLDVFKYYEPGRGSRYFAVEQSGDTDRDGSDSKVASKRVKVVAEIGIPGLVKAQIEYVKAHTTTEHTDPKAATAGEYGAATAGYRGAATSWGSVSVGDYGVGTVRGENVRIRGGIGAMLTIAGEQANSLKIAEWKSFLIDGEKYLPDTWYQLKNGEIVEIDGDA